MTREDSAASRRDRRAGGDRRWVSLAVLVVAATVASGCSSQGWFGVTRTDDGLVLLSGCTDEGFTTVRAGPDTGAFESDAMVHPVVSEATFDARWIGAPKAQQRRFPLMSPPPGYEVTGDLATTFDSADGGAIVIEVDFDVSVGASQQVILDDLRPGSVQLRSDDEPGTYELVSIAEFEERTTTCPPAQSNPWLGWVLAAASATLLVVALAVPALLGTRYLRNRRKPMDKLQTQPPQR